MANDHESASPQEARAWVSQAERSARPELGPVEDDSSRVLPDLLLELAALEEALRVLRSTKPSPDVAPWSADSTQLKSRQRLVLRELRHRARHRVRLRPGQHDQPAPHEATPPAPGLTESRAQITPLEPTG
jgi:hypothetical protein